RGGRRACARLCRRRRCGERGTALRARGRPRPAGPARRHRPGARPRARPPGNCVGAALVSIADEQRVTLPARAYVERDIFEAELDDLFARGGVFVCPERVVAEPGSFATASVAGEPGAGVRGDDGERRALSNVCRHRAMQILSGTGRCPKVLRCPYHGWTYRQDGRLAAVPEARGFPALDREGGALPSFRVESLAGLVFVSLDAEVPPLAEWFGDVAERLETLGIGG